MGPDPPPPSSAGAQAPGPRSVALGRRDEEVPGGAAPKLRGPTAAGGGLGSLFLAPPCEAGAPPLCGTKRARPAGCWLLTSCSAKMCLPRGVTKQSNPPVPLNAAFPPPPQYFYLCFRIDELPLIPPPRFIYLFIFSLPLRLAHVCSSPQKFKDWRLCPAYIALHA